MINITKRVRFRSYIKENFVNFDFYDVKSGETPEYIANEFYGDPQLHWIILHTNDIIDYYNDWPMTVPQFERYVRSKYDDIDAIHHYEYIQESGDTKFTIELPKNIGYCVRFDHQPLFKGLYFFPQANYIFITSL